MEIKQEIQKQAQKNIKRNLTSEELEKVSKKVASQSGRGMHKMIGVDTVIKDFSNSSNSK